MLTLRSSIVSASIVSSFLSLSNPQALRSAGPSLIGHWPSVARFSEDPILFVLSFDASPFEADDRDSSLAFDSCYLLKTKSFRPGRFSLPFSSSRRSH